MSIQELARGESQMKKVVIIVAVLLVVAIVAVTIIASQSGTIIKHAVEEFGPEITGTTVTLSDVDVSLLSGEASINNLVIGNPEGFKSDSAIKLGAVEVKLDLGSLTSDKILINKILMDSAELTFEVGKGGSNISALQKNIEQRTAKISGQSSSAAKPDAADGESPEMAIDHIYINGTRVNVVTSLLGGKGTALVIPDIHMKDIGKGDKGALPADVVNQVFALLSKSVVAAVSKELPADQIKESVGKAVGDKVKDVGGKLKGLFGQ